MLRDLPKGAGPAENDKSYNHDDMPKEFRQIQWDAQLEDDCRQLIRLAVREDLDRTYDWTTVALVPADSLGKATIVSRQPGAVAGLRLMPLLVDELDAELKWTGFIGDGDRVEPGTRLGELEGAARDLFVAERLALNFLGHLCGIASLTAEYVELIRGTHARVYDTRKTTPGYRRLEKYAVRCGGGFNHRAGLYEAVLIKDNHLAFGDRTAQQRFNPAEAVSSAREFLRKTLPPEVADEMIIEIEVDTLEQLSEVLPAEPDIVLLDNMTPQELAVAVERRDAIRPEVQLEASGTIRRATIRPIAESGVDRISVGELTHSARSLDVGLDWD